MIYVWIIGLSLLVTAVFSAAEMSFIAANRLRLRHMAEGGHRTAIRYLEAFRSPERLLSTAMMGVTIAHITASSVATWALIPVVGGGAALLVTAALTPLMLVFGEVIPKAVARERATGLILILFPVVETLGKVLAPLTWGANALVGRALALVGREPTGTRQFVSREELKLLLQMEPEEADVTVTEAEMIDKIFDLGETAVREVMVPLVDVAALPETASPADAVRLIQERGFSRIPVFTDRAFNIVGVVTTMDLLSQGVQAPDLRSLMRAATYVPETKRIDELLREMQKNRVQLAVVVDEYGGAVGIVTVEDIVEEIVGEIKDEYDVEAEPIVVEPDGAVLVAGRVNVDRLEQALEVPLAEGDNVDTVGGLVAAAFGRVPRTGERIDYKGFTIEVVSAEHKRVNRVRFRRKPAQAEAS